MPISKIGAKTHVPDAPRGVQKVPKIQTPIEQLVEKTLKAESSATLAAKNPKPEKWTSINQITNYYWRELMLNKGSDPDNPPVNSSASKPSTELQLPREPQRCGHSYIVEQQERQLKALAEQLNSKTSESKGL